MLDDESQAALIARAVAGEQYAMEMLLWAHHDRLRGYLAARLPQNPDPLLSAEDLLQETFMQAWRDVRRYEPREPAAFSAWLQAIAEHRLQDALKAARAAKRGGGRRALPGAAPEGTSSIADLLDVLGWHEETPSRSAARHEAERALQVALSGLKTVYRQVLLLRYLQDLPMAEVAVRMGRSKGSVQMLCQRALLKLREALGRSSQYLSSRS
jgi:RNA polymerase sigma-70 factor (ECF subfamily)